MGLIRMAIYQQKPVKCLKVKTKFVSVYLTDESN